MAEENIPAFAPTRSDEQILPFNAWLLVGKGNLPLDLQKSQKNPIFHISVDILQNINFLRAFTALVNVLTIYIQQFWNTVVHDEKTKVYSFQLDEQWFTLNVDLLHEALEITPVDSTHPFESPPAGEQYLEMVAHKPTAKKGGQKKTTSKAGKPKKPAPAKQPALAEQTKPMKEKTSKPSPSKKIRKGKVMKVRKGERTDHLVDEEDKEPQPAPEIPVEEDEYNLQRGITQRLLVVEGKGKGIATDKQVAQSLLELQNPKKQNAETGADTEKSNIEGNTKILNVDEERDPGKTPESRPPPERILMEEDQVGSNPGQSHVVLAGPNLEPMHKDFVATVYPQVHKILKHTTKDHVHIENPLSSSGTLLSMKNLDDSFTFGDQILNDKPTEEEPGKANVETEVESMVTIPNRQASSSAPPLSTPIIDLTPPKPISPLAQEPVFTATTATTLPLPPPLSQQSTTGPALATRVSTLENICASFEKKHNVEDKTTQALSSRVFTLENHDLYSKIDNHVNKTVKEVVHNALQALIRDCFRELSEFKIKEILRDRMFESGSYRSHPEHAALYNALEVYVDRKNKGEFIEATTKSRKRRRDDHDPPLKDSDQSKKKRHDSDASASKQPPPVDDVPIPDDVHFSNSKDIGVAHLPNIKTRLDWLKPVPEEEAPETPEPDWVVPPNDLPETENN
ncbi:hypothetical protein Tco_0409743 [Tanacetum coccineum]